MQVTLNLSTPHGLLYVDFTPALTVAQYGHLLTIAKGGQSADEVRDAIRVWSLSESVAVRFDQSAEYIRP